MCWLHVCCSLNTVTLLLHWKSPNNGTVAFFALARLSRNHCFAKCRTKCRPIEVHGSRRKKKRIANENAFFFNILLFWTLFFGTIHETFYAISMMSPFFATLHIHPSRFDCLCAQWFWPWATTKGSIMMKDKHQKLINYILCTILAEYIQPSHSHICILRRFSFVFRLVFCFFSWISYEIARNRFCICVALFCFFGFWNIFGCRTIQIVFSISSLLSQLFFSA